MESNASMASSSICGLKYKSKESNAWSMELCVQTHELTCGLLEILRFNSIVTRMAVIRSSIPIVLAHQPSITLVILTKYVTWKSKWKGKHNHRQNNAQSILLTLCNEPQHLFRYERSLHSILSLFSSSHYITSFFPFHFGSEPNEHGLSLVSWWHTWMGETPVGSRGKTGHFCILFRYNWFVFPILPYTRSIQIEHS